MEKARTIGIDAYNLEQRAKAAILNDLLAHYNDGRRKSFYCIAVNLLDIEELQHIKRMLEADTAITCKRPKEKAAYAVQLIQASAEQHNIVLKLRKK